MPDAKVPDPRDMFKTHGNAVMLPCARQDELIRLEGQKRHDLLEADCNEVLGVSTLDDLKENPPPSTLILLSFLAHTNCNGHFKRYSTSS